MSNKELKPIRVTDAEAIKIVHEHAPKQRRSLANCAAAAIISALSSGNSNKRTVAEQEENGKAKTAN